MIHAAWVPSLALGAVLAAGGAGINVGDVATILGAAAAVISAVTGMIIAIRRKDGPVIIVTPEEAEQMGLGAPLKPRKARKKADR